MRNPENTGFSTALMRDNHENISTEKELIKTTKHKQAIAAAIMEKLQPGDTVHIPRKQLPGRPKENDPNPTPDRLPARGIVESILPGFVVLRMLANTDGRPLYRECFRPVHISPKKGGTL